MTLYELQQSKLDYESKRVIALDKVARGLMSKIELLEFDIAHLNAFSAKVMLYLYTLAGDAK
jgi:hypothetical protein